MLRFFRFTAGFTLLGLEVTNLTCVKRDRELFSGLSFSLSPGQLIYLQGPNGAGKTSLLRIITGLSEPESGSITMDGEEVGTDRYNFNHQIIYVGHKPAVNGSLTAIENLTFWCAQQQTGFVEQFAYDTLAELGLVGLEDTPTRFLSAGQQRRVALARLWLKPAKYWVLDEPFTALDADGVALLERLINSQVANGVGVITTSHQPLSELAGPYTNLVLEYKI